MTLSQLADLVATKGRRIIEKQKMETLGVFIAVTSLFDKGKPIRRYFDELDRGLQKISVPEDAVLERMAAAVSSGSVPRKRSTTERQRGAQHSVNELMKLTKIMRSRSMG